MPNTTILEYNRMDKKGRFDFQKLKREIVKSGKK